MRGSPAKTAWSSAVRVVIDAPARTRITGQYPADTVEMRVLADGRPLLLRPLGARDSGLLQDFVRALSPRSRYQRFFDVP